MPASWLSLFVLLSLFSANDGRSFDHNPLILVSLDGMGWQFISGKFAKTPNLDGVGRAGVKAKYIKTVFPAKTWPNHHSYLTGLYPESHGIISNRFWDPVFEEEFILAYDCSNFDPKFYEAAEPIWLTLQKQGGRSAVYNWPGGTSYKEKPTYYNKPMCVVNCSEVDSKLLPSMRNKTRVGYPPYIHCVNNVLEPFSSQIDKVMDWLKSDKPPRFIALYSNQPDSTAHGFGIGERYVRKIEEVDADVVGYLIKSLEKEDFLDHVNVMFVSDHSFTATSSSRQIYLDDYVDPSSYTLIESGPLGSVWPHDGKLDEVFANLTRAQNPHMKAYKREDIPESYHWSRNRRIPPIYVRPGVGWLVTQSRNDAPGNWTGAAHGWPQEDSSEYSIFFARGPDFRTGFEAQPFNTIDLYPLICQMLGIEPRPHNGSFEYAKAILRGSQDPTSGQPRLTGSFRLVDLLAPALLLVLKLTL